MTPKQLAASILLVLGALAAFLTIGWIMFYNKSVSPKIKQESIDDFLEKFKDTDGVDAAYAEAVYMKAQNWIYNGVLIHTVITCCLLSIAFTLLLPNA